MGEAYLLGLIFALVSLTICRTSAEIIGLNEDKDQVQAESANSFTSNLPSSQVTTQSGNQVPQAIERRLSLEDFFLNRNNEQQEVTPPAAQQAPVMQFQVQQPDPNSLFLVRDAQFPSSSGGLISRLLMARRILRLRRIARRLTIIPSILGLGLRQQLRQAQGASAQARPLALFSNRVGQAYPQPYNPRDYVFGNKAFTYSKNATASQDNDASDDQVQQQTRGYPLEAEPYYDSVNDLPYDSYDNSNLRGADSYESDDLKSQYRPQHNLNPVRTKTDNGGLLISTGHDGRGENNQQLINYQLLQQLQNYHQQLNNQLLQQNVQQPDNQLQQAHQPHINQPSSYQQNSLQNYQNQQPRELDNSAQYHQPEFNENLFHQNQHHEPQTQAINDQQQELVRLQQLQLLRNRLRLLQQLQQSQLAQQNQNYAQKNQDFHSNVDSNEQNYQHSKEQQDQQNHPGDRTENSGFVSVGGGAGLGANTIGLGVNVGIKPPALDIQVTNPVGHEIKPLPSIAYKPAPPPPVEEPLVPIGFLPKPLLNMKGRLFFGAELGKDVKVNTGVGR